MSSHVAAAEKTPAQQAMAAAAWMGGLLVCFLLMAVSAREAMQSLSAIQLLFYRSLLAIVIVVVVAGLTGPGLSALATRRPGAHILRNLFQFTGQFGWFYAIGLIPLAQVFAIEFTAPLWVGLLAPLVLGERMTRGRTVSLVLGFIGVLAVVRPGLVDINSGTIAILIGAVGFGCGMIMTKSLSRTEAPITVIFYMSVMQAVLSGPFAVSQAVAPTWTAVYWISAVALTGLVAHFCLVRALSLADALTVAPMDFVRLPLVMLLGIVLYAEPFDPWVLLGGALILAGNYCSLRGERQRRPLG